MERKNKKEKSRQKYPAEGQSEFIIGIRFYQSYSCSAIPIDFWRFLTG